MMKTLLHFCKFLLKLENPVSFGLTNEELAVLLKYSRKIRVIVEIGCFEGKTSAALAQNTSGFVYAIDIFPTGMFGISYSEWIAKIHCKRKGIKNITFIKDLSHKVAQDFREQIDFLFIDGDHRYEAVKQDWLDWFHKVRNGGIIALHDCKQTANHPYYLGSMQLYEQDISTMKEVEEIDSVDSLVIFKVNR